MSDWLLQGGWTQWQGRESSLGFSCGSILVAGQQLPTRATQVKEGCWEQGPFLIQAMAKWGG